MNTPEGRARLGKCVAALKLALLFVIVVGVPAFVLLCHAEWLANFRSLDAVNAMIERHKTASALSFVALQIAQVVISVIPGQAVQVASGYAFAFPVACVLSLGGLGAGSLIAYGLSRALGRDALHLFLGEGKTDRFVRTLNSRNAYIALFVIFLIPGIPKDLFAYAAGLSEMRVSAFVLISLTARLPAMMLSVAFGGAIRSGSYVAMASALAALAVLCVCGLIFRARLTRLIDDLYRRMTADAKQAERM